MPASQGPDSSAGDQRDPASDRAQPPIADGDALEEAVAPDTDIERKNIDIPWHMLRNPTTLKEMELLSDVERARIEELTRALVEDVHQLDDPYFKIMTKLNGDMSLSGERCYMEHAEHYLLGSQESLKGLEDVGYYIRTKSEALYTLVPIQTHRNEDALIMRLDQCDEERLIFRFRGSVPAHCSRAERRGLGCDATLLLPTDSKFASLLNEDAHGVHLIPDAIRMAAIVLKGKEGADWLDAPINGGRNPRGVAADWHSRETGEIGGPLNVYFYVDSVHQQMYRSDDAPNAKSQDMDAIAARYRYAPVGFRETAVNVEGVSAIPRELIDVEVTPIYETRRKWFRDVQVEVGQDRKETLVDIHSLSDDELANRLSGYTLFKI